MCHGSPRPARWAPALLAIASLTASTAGADAVFDARGFNPYRPPTSELPYEHVDPLTGNLLLTFTDLVLPGNAGFDLRIQRTYNSKLYPNYAASAGGQRAPSEDTWAGVGWTLHLGRIPDSGSSAATPPPIEMADGSQHRLFPHVDGSGRFITRDYWIYDKPSRVLKLPNGLEYTFGKGLTLPSGESYFYVTRITDPYGNQVTVAYMQDPLPRDGIASITQTVGGSSRTVTFQATNDALKRLTRMSYLGRNWTYSGSAINVTHSLMTAMTPPVGPGWSFTYYGSSTTQPLPLGLKTVTTPFGGVISYEYQTVEFWIGSTAMNDSPVLSRRTVGGADLAPGVWTYAYAQGQNSDQTVIQSPCSTVTHTFEGVGTYTTPGAVWRVGLPLRKVVKAGAVTLESEEVHWEASTAISDDVDSLGFNTDYGIFVPLRISRTLNRGTGSCTATPPAAGCYRTTWTYRSTNFNDYGRPWTVTETGERSRTRTFIYKYGFTPRYIVDKLESETLQEGTESFTSSYTYNPATGFKTGQTIRGVTTTFTPDAYGNIASETDANNNVRSYQYEWGTLKRIETETYKPLLTRVINSDGTIQSETRSRQGTNGFTTTFSYDNLMRLKSRTPHQGLGNATVAEYDLLQGGVRYNRTTRGPSRLDTFLDGFGRPSATVNSAGVKTDLEYDACGRKTWESLPYTTVIKGYSYSYDGLDRLQSKTNPDGTSVTYSYSQGIDVTIRDERKYVTLQDWSAYGEPADALLAGVTDADGKAWTYSYNALGSLTRVHPPTGPDRTWTYYGTEADGRPGLLKTETHPEAGAVTYKYDAAGRMRSRQDTQFGTTTFGYDKEDRLTLVDRPTAYDAHDKTFAWDESNNKTLISNKYVQSTLAYDGVNRLLSRTDVVKPCYPSTSCATRTFVTSYPSYDGNDNLEEIVYPSGTRVTYEYDSENRIVKVGKPGAAGAFATSFEYHPSGGIASYRAGNNLVHTTTYNDRHFVGTIDAGGVLGLSYLYDDAGNPQSITETTRPGMSQALTYDKLERLETASGPWGSLSFEYYATGNRKTKTLAGAQTTYSYDFSTQRLSSSAGAEAASYSYDGNGNTTEGGNGSSAQQSAYTPDNMLLWATVNGGTTNYRYDADDVRKLKIDASNRYYLHGLGGQLLSEFAEDGSGLRSVRDDVYAGTRLVAAVRPSTPPFGSFDTPANGATGLAGEIMVTGWALDEHGVSKVQIFRDPVAGEAPGLLVYIGDGVFVPGARPDVENTFKSYPNADRAGWGYALLSNFLPNGGNGTYTLHARVTDDDGNTTSLGTKTIGVSNASSPKPFGTLDTPGQGQTVSGSGYMVWGWALTPQPDIIPVDGSTIWVFVDNVPLGHPVYNLYRADLAAAFPGLRNTNGAAGYFVLNTTALSNGLHTIAWTVRDSGGDEQGIGSRYFWVQN